jgi:hypothetical protein
MKIKIVTALLSCATTCFVLLTGLFGCALPGSNALELIGDRHGNFGFRNTLIRKERIVALEKGNLSEKIAASSQERITIMQEFLQKYEPYFGGSPKKDNKAELRMIADEQKSIFDNETVHYTLVMHQEYKGAIVLDASISCEFVGSDEKGSQLRRVKGHLFDSAAIVNPISNSKDNIERAERQFRDFLVRNMLSVNNMSVLTTPVIIGENNITGFLGQYAQSYKDGSTDRLSVVINPLSKKTHIIYYIPACRAHDPLGDK